MIGSTSEDDVVEALNLIRYGSLNLFLNLMYYREKELLYGPHSLLRRYSPLVVEICSRNDIYKVKRTYATTAANFKGSRFD